MIAQDTLDPRQMPASESSAIRPLREGTHGDVSYVLIAVPSASRAATWRQVAMETGHPVVVVRDGDEAQAQITSRGVPALLVTDLSLPKLDGFTLVRNLRQLPRGETTSVIVVCDPSIGEQIARLVDGWRAGEPIARWPGLAPDRCARA